MDAQPTWSTITRRGFMSHLTAFGLVAAIPAVMIYNVLARQTAHYRGYLGDASAQVMRLVSRDLDRAKLPMTQAAE